VQNEPKGPLEVAFSSTSLNNDALAGDIENQSNHETRSADLFQTLKQAISSQKCLMAGAQAKEPTFIHSLKAF
jgi:hypothetical protein